MTDLKVLPYAVEVEYSIGATPEDGPWTFDFAFFDYADVKVHIEESDGTTHDLTHNSGMTVTGIAVDGGYDGGQVDTDITYTNATLKVYRDTVIDRQANYPVAGPVSMNTLNTELNKYVAIMQELDAQKNKYINLPDDALSTDPWDLEGRIASNAGEGTAENSLATNRQVDASGPNWLADSNNEGAIGAEGAWHTIWSESGIVIQGNDTTRRFDLMTEFFGYLQNRDTNEATIQVRYRYQVDCYAQVSKQTNANYMMKIPGTSMVPFPFMDIEQDIDYTNGNCTLYVAIDIKPVGVDSELLYLEWYNFAVNTSEPR